jgi:hypothetical protein
MLVKSGADANLPMGDGQTAVHVAAVGGNLAVLRVLLQNGGDAQIADKEGETALHKVKSFSFFSLFIIEENDSYLLFLEIACLCNFIFLSIYFKTDFSRVEIKLFRNARRLMGF